MFMKPWRGRARCSTARCYRPHVGDGGRTVSTRARLRTGDCEVNSWARLTPNGHPIANHTHPRVFPMFMTGEPTFRFHYDGSIAYTPDTGRRGVRRPSKHNKGTASTYR